MLFHVQLSIVRPREPWLGSTIIVLRSCPSRIVRGAGLFGSVRTDYYLIVNGENPIIKLAETG